MENGSSAGTATVATISPVHIQGEAEGTSQLAARVRNDAGADRVRRRLSRIFQRPMIGIWMAFRFSGPE